MIYNSVDTIPAKLYFKILETGELHLLTDEEISFEELEEVWNNLQDENDKVSQNKEMMKVVDISKRIEAISSKQKSVELAASALKLKPNEKDKELIDLLKSYDYKFQYENIIDYKKSQKQYLKDLDKIERENKSESVRIKRLEKQLPEVKEQKEKSSFDEVVINYGVITGSGFIDTNKITLSQYHALIKIGNQKIKALENGEG